MRKVGEVLVHILLGVGVSASIFYFSKGSDWLRAKEHIPEWAIHAFVIALLTALVTATTVLRRVHVALATMEEKGQARLNGAVTRINGELSTLGHRLQDLRNLIEQDERIIMARREPMHGSTPFSVIGVEDLDQDLLPRELNAPDVGDQWDFTISILKFSRFQDLLFSVKYLRHFLSIANVAENQYRIVVVNDQIRQGAEAALKAFLSMSEALGIKTAVVRKGEFHEFASQSANAPIRQLLTEQAELSIVNPASRYKSLPGGLSSSDAWCVRYRPTEGKVEEKRSATSTDVPTEIARLYDAMRLMISEPDRVGSDNLGRVLKGYARNPWKP